MPISDMDAHSLEQYINPPKKSISLYMSLRHLAEVMPLENYHMLIYNYHHKVPLGRSTIRSGRVRYERSTNKAAIALNIRRGCVHPFHFF